MVAYLLRRSVGIVATLLATTLLTYLLIYLVPGDPAAVIVAQRIGGRPTAEQIAQVRSTYGLDQPPWVQYWHWASRIVQGDFGYSIRTGQPVLREIGIRLGPTLLLAGLTTLCMVLVGVSAGIVAAAHEQRGWDHLLRIGALLGVSIPDFWLAFLLILVFAVHLHWLPTHGMRGLAAWLLPTICLGLANAARLSRLTRTALLEVRQQDYMRTVQAKGLPSHMQWWRHALPNAAIPLLTLVATQFSHMVAGSIIIETLFAWPGIGQLYMQAVSFRDLPVIQALVLLFALTFALVNFAADLTYVWIDPRIRLG